MPRLRSLKLHVVRCGDSSPESLAPLWAAPWFPQLHELSVTIDRGFGSPGLAQLRAAPLLQKLYLRTFDSAAVLTDADGRALAAAALPALRELRLRNAAPGLVAALAAAPWMLRLEFLLVTARGWPSSGLAAADGRALAAVQLPSLKRLRALTLERGFMAACSAGAWLSCLERLDLSSDEGDLLDGGGGGGGGGGGTPEGSFAWAATPFTALVSLTLQYGGDDEPPFDTPCLAALVAAPWFGRLQHLELDGWPVGTDEGSDGVGLRALAAAPLPSLTSLNLHSACLSAADVSGVLSSAPWLAALKRLSLVYNHGLGASGHRALSLLRLPRLQELSLVRNDFDAMGLAALATAPWLTQLSRLYLDEDVGDSRTCTAMRRAMRDDAWVFGRLRRLGCNVVAYLAVNHIFPFNDVDPDSDGELLVLDPDSDDPGSEDPGSDNPGSDDPGSGPGDV
jgi:hypothetical protein